MPLEELATCTVLLLFAIDLPFLALLSVLLFVPSFHHAL
jgi:hypothetical protein